jgi:multicomponent Na+:H+ antiporter subunit D
VAAGGALPLVLVGAGIVTSLLTLVAVSRVWSRAFWRPARDVDGSGPAADDEAGIPRDDRPANAASEPAADQERRGARRSHVGTTRRDLRENARRRRVALATADDDALDAAFDRAVEGSGSTSVTDPDEARGRLPRYLTAPAVALVVVSIGLTGLAGPLYGLADRAAADLLDRRPYVSAVYGDEAPSSAEDVP